jgi:hypothetical protein
MPNIKIRGQTVDVDIESELREFDWGYRARWTPTKLIAASPFRYDQQPSFFVNLDGDYAGTWKDSGAYDSEWESGGFVKLLSFLRNETYEETAEYLLEKYAPNVYSDELKLRLPKLKLPEGPPKLLPESTVTPAVSGYLLRRGIDDETQRLYGVGYGRYKGFTTIPWRLPDGKLANVKYRATRGKTFFYERNAYPIRRVVWGLDVVNRMNAKRAALCEAEIDAMTWTASGLAYGIATGGVTFTDEQADLIRRSPIAELILAGDNDKAGRKFNEAVRQKLSGYVRLYEVDYGGAKDANEVGAEMLKSVRISEIKPKFIRCI